VFFNFEVYKKRMRLAAELFLLEAEQRARDENRLAYCHIIGLGLGVWEFIPQQGKWFMQAFRDVLKSYAFQRIANLNFSWFADPQLKIFEEFEGRIKVEFSRRDPAEKLVDEDEGKLLVAMYAWDSNAFAGNEYWMGQLNASGDPAAASCSTIAEIQNPLINQQFSSNIWVYPLERLNDIQFSNKNIPISKTGSPLQKGEENKEG